MRIVLKSVGQLIAVLIFAFSLLSCNSGKSDKMISLDKLEFHIDWSPGPDYIGFFVANELGYYKDERLSVNIRSGNGAESAAKLLASNTIAVGTTTIDALIRQQIARRNQVPKLPSAKSGLEDKLSSGTSEGLDSSPRVAAIIFITNPVVLVTDAAKVIKRLEDLNGLTIGYSEESSVTYAQFKSLLSRNPKVRLKKLVKVGWNGPQELRSGKVDGVLAYATDVPPELKKQDYLFNMKRLADFGLSIPGQCIAVAPHPQSPISKDTLDRFLRATVRGWEFSRANPSQAAELYVSRFPGQDRQKVLSAIEYTIELLPPVIGGDPFAAYTDRAQLKDKVLGAVATMANMVKPIITPNEAAQIVQTLVGQ